jgi:HEPN domain-containing protein
MKPETSEWVDKAEADYHSALLLLRARKHANYDGACFHAQQCAEKYMKAVLQEAGQAFDRTHDLSALLLVIAVINPMWTVLGPASQALSDYAVRFRYPGASADKALARDAVRACEMIRTHLRAYFTPRKRKRIKLSKRRRKR